MIKNKKGISLISLVLIIVAIIIIIAVVFFLIMNNNDNNANISNSVDTNLNVNDSNILKENNQISTSDDSKNEIKEKQISLTDDLTEFGYLYKDLFILSNDISEHKTVDEVVEYINQKGLSVYPYSSADLTNTKTIEEIYSKYEWILKPNDFINNIHDKYNGKYSSVVIGFKNDENGVKRINSIQYSAQSLYSSSVPNDFRNFMNKQLEKFESTKISGDYNNWKYAYIYLGRKVDKNKVTIQKEIAEISAIIGETSFSLTIKYI